MARDLYDVLGVSRQATADQIKAAYRALVRKLHPDVNKAPDAAAKFNEVQQAYDVLADDAKRRRYDAHGLSGLEDPQPHAGPRGGRPRPARSAPHAGAPDIDPEDLSEMFDSFFGGGASPFDAPRGQRGPFRPQREEARAQVTIDFETAARGGTQTLRVDGPSPQMIDVRIPAGIEDGAHLRVRGEGAKGRRPEIILTVRVGQHALWRRGERSEGKGLDLYLDLPLTYAEAALGAQVSVPTLSGPVEVAVPPGSVSGRKLRLRNKGIRDEQGRYGDLYAEIRIVVPKGPFSPEEQRLLQEISTRDPSPRAGPGWPA